jgi:hypothetical protein
MDRRFAEGARIVAELGPGGAPRLSFKSFDRDDAGATTRT